MIYADRVQETTTTTGTGSLTLAGAVATFRTFASALTTGDEVTYCVVGETEWEVGRGTFTAPATLSRAQVYASSNAGSAVSLSAGTKNVFLTQSASTLTDTAAVAAAVATEATARASADEALDARLDAAESDIAALQDGGGSSPTLVSFSSLLGFEANERMVFSGDGSEACVLAVDATATPIEGGAVEVFIPAGEAGSLVVADEFRNRDDDNLQTFDPAADYWFLATYTNGRYVATGQVLSDPDTTAPTIVSADIDSGAPDKLVLTMSSPAMLPALTGLSLTFNVGTARTLTSVVSGNGTTTITLDLSGDVADGDDIDLVVGTGQLLQDLNGNLVGTGTTAVTLSGFGGPAFAFGDELHLWDATSMTTSGGSVLSVDDQIGSADVAPGANLPTVTTIGSLAAPAWQFVTDSHLAVDAADTLTSGYLACIVDLATLDAQFGLISIGEFGALTTIAAVLWKTPSNNIQGIVGDGDAGVAGSFTSAGVADVVVTWSATERSIYVNGSLLNTVTAPASATNGGRWVLGDVPNKGGTFDAATVKMYEARVGPSHLSAGDVSDYHDFRLATVGT